MDDLVRDLKWMAGNPSICGPTHSQIAKNGADRIESLSAELTALHIVYRERLASWMMANSIATGHGEIFDDLLGELRDHLERAKPARSNFVCAVRNGSVGANDPQDCNWPMCSCDGHADAVIAALQEARLMKESVPLISVERAETPRTCETCVYQDTDDFAEPCVDCGWHDRPYWTPKPNTTSKENSHG